MAKRTKRQIPEMAKFLYESHTSLRKFILLPHSEVKDSRQRRKSDNSAIKRRRRKFEKARLIKDVRY